MSLRKFCIFLIQLFFLDSILKIKTSAIFAANTTNYCEHLLDKSGDEWTIAIWKPGRYCIGQDLHQSDPIFRLPHQAVPRSALLEIRSNHVFADLKQHHLISKVKHREGVWAFGTSPSQIKSITIKNGTISTNLGPTIFMVDAFDDGTDIRFGQNFSIASSGGDLAKYRPTDFILENLTLKADGHAIIMQGMRNIIRHCKIIGGNGTVNLFGPQLIFEENEIVFKAKENSSRNDEAPVALHLEDAANSIIRNNHIIVQGRAALSTAITLKNSTNVTLEGNTITGAGSIYELLDERSSVTAINNRMKQ